MTVYVYYVIIKCEASLLNFLFLVSFRKIKNIDRDSDKRMAEKNKN